MSAATTPASAREPRRAVVGVVLVGGVSSRMGADKAALLLDGRPWAELVAAALRGGGLSVLFVGRAPADAVPGCGDGRWIPDLPELAATGPLAGLVSAARAAPSDDLLVAACDHPRLTSDAVKWLLRAAADRPDAAVVGAQLDRPLPTFALYRRTFFEALESTPPTRSRPGDRGISLQRAAAQAGAHWQTAPSEVASTLASANTPAELETLLGTPAAPHSRR